MRKDNTFIIVGASLAGATAAATLRDEGFDGVTAESPEAELRRIAAHHPVYKIQGLQMRRAT